MAELVSTITEFNGKPVVIEVPWSDWNVGEQGIVVEAWSAEDKDRPNASEVALRVFLRLQNNFHRDWSVVPYDCVSFL